MKKMVRTIMIGAALVLTAAPAAEAEIGWHGFVEGAYGARVVTDPKFEGRKDYTLQETRAQLRLEHFGPVGESFVRLDLTQDQVASNDTDVAIREGYLRFTTLGDKLTVKAGRQALTWGTGDLVFINDLFPKDWVSFFVGREDQYLKAPVDAVRLGIYGLPMDADVVLAPQFTPDRLPTGERLSFYVPPMVQLASPLMPASVVENGELSVKLSRYVGNWSLALYGYSGFFKTPIGLTTQMHSYYPELSVYGASLRGGLLSGVVWVEGGLYDSRDDRDGDNPFVPNGSLRYLAGYERQWLPDFNIGLQYYGERMSDHASYVAVLPAGMREEDEFRHLVTARFEKMLHYQTIRLSLFAFYSPTDEDVHIRGMASYRLSDEVEVAAGGNVFDGKRNDTQFGQFDANDNLYLRLRYVF